MLKFVIVLAAFSVFVNGQAPCCFPDQYEGSWAGVIAGYDLDTENADSERTFVMVSVDTSDDNNILYHGYELSVNTYSGERKTENRLVRNGRLYTYNETNCESKPAVRPEFTGCIGDSAQYRTTTYIGQGDHKLRFHVWRLSLTNSTATVAVTDNCIPLSFDSAGRSGSILYAQASTFVGFTAGIRDNSVFDVPAYCSI